MFNFCKYIRTNEFLIIGNNESSMATMSHTNILWRSKIQMFFLNNRFEMKWKASNNKFLLRST